MTREAFNTLYMMKKWNEITSITLKDIMRQFIDFKDWTTDKVIEIQCPTNIVNGLKNNRFYFCNSINWKKFLKDSRVKETFLKAIELMAKDKTTGMTKENPDSIMERLLSPGNVFYYISLSNNNPLIVPIICGEVSKSENLLLNSFLADDMFDTKMQKNIIGFIDNNETKWYLKNGGERLIDSTPGSYTKYSPSDKYYRIRAIEYKEWEDIIENLLRTGNLDGCEDDLKVNDFKK